MACADESGNVKRGVTIVKCGVVNLSAYSSGITVNQDDLIQLLRDAVEKHKPARDCSGSFAGRVVIELEFLGDMSEQPSTESV